MQQVLIPIKRVKLLDKKTLESISKRLNCKIHIEDENQVVIEGDAYDEYNAKNIISAFGRGFDMNQAYTLLSEEYFFTPINLKEMFRNKDQLMRVKGRIIGENGKTKEYIEAVSGAKLCIYENTVSLIGTIEQIKVANVAINILLEGGTHKKAYRVMEKARRGIR
ncbi:MAG: KH domain-containing protein [Candidatus Micrarchaeales archaeon]